MTACPSSPPPLPCENSPRSVSPLRAVGYCRVHEPIVRPIGGPRKAPIVPYKYVQFAEEVRDLMRWLNVTIREAADWSGFSEKTIGKWRRGASAPDINEGRRFVLCLIRKAGERDSRTGT